ncbi:hypothetical protein GCM10007862_09490 [Dyella lipolytica]|uniref:Uncharacterized protein n=1 Tax=Dyella lipolytica TaxID=1867835 RepID=A0ABW8J123_9GAMM|nr:hypothetical protein [Dyella lipolytica]GLQ45898.1 hypothetical protein GCM10007862_09490 [Dyella lipolytica]
MTVNQGALVETLIQLSDFRQYGMAESLLAACERAQLEQLLLISDRAFNQRLVYSLERQLKRSREATYKPRGSLLAVLVGIFNRWCNEGHRPAIRCVSGELKRECLAALMRLPELDREVYSMMREFSLPEESTTSCGCSY